MPSTVIDQHACDMGSISDAIGSEFSEIAAARSECNTIFRANGTQWLDPVQVDAQTITNRACHTQTISAVRDIMLGLSDDDYLVFLKDYYAAGQRKFADCWHYADLLTYLYAATKIVAPRNYLEIGVRRARSLAIVGAAAPECQIFGFDMWVENYAGMDNPGVEFVRDEMSNIGHRGRLELISGDSHETVPKFLADNSQLTFDLINVDGDHTEAGARADLETVLPRLAHGGIIVLDDITHPQHRYLEVVWDELIGNNAEFSSSKYTDLGYGVAVAVKK